MTTNPTEQIIADAGKWESSLSEESKISDKVQEIYDEEAFSCSTDEGEAIKYVPTPNFTDCGSADSQLPINVANGAITILSKYRAEFDFVDFIKEKLQYSSRVGVCMAFFSEQIDALVLAIKQFESGKAFILGDMAGLGKGRSQPLSAKILTPNGWKTMGDMKIGSKVISVDGATTKVVGVYPQGKIDVYKITFSDGTSTECSADHLWSVKKRWQKDHIKNNPKSKACDYVVMTTEEIKKSIKKRIEIPITKPVIFKESEVSVDPYLLGVLLGDACIRECGIELTNADSEILDSVSLIIDNALSLKKTREYHYQISKKSRKGWHIPNKLLTELRKLNLTGKTAPTKFIPDCYKFNSIDVRLSILQGLMDTDGYIEAGGSSMYYTVSDKLADDVSFIVQSLGGTTSRGIKKTYRLDCHVVYIKLPNEFKIFRLSRKLKRVKERTKYFPIRIVRSVEKVGQKECQCIKVEHESSLYLTDNCIVTHNTCAGILRYAYVNKIVPTFITEKENLFSDIFRDIIGIGGFGGSGSNMIMPQPFIMNPLDKIKLRDANNNPVKDEKGRYIYVNNNDVLDDNGVVLYTPLITSRIDYLLKSNKKVYDVNFASLKKKAKEFDYDFNSVFLTYSVISQTRGESGENKKAFIRNIAKDSIVILDECHNASGNSKLGEQAKLIVSDAKGVLFSSATYAKNPQSFPLYIIKTAMAEAQIDVANIEKAIGIGGENVSEYIASVLVKEGQMIRREKDFRGCTMGNVFEGSDKIGAEAVREKERIYKLFNDAVIQFKGIYNYVKSSKFTNAVDNAIDRALAESGIELADQEAYILAKTGKDKDKNQKEFILENRGKWVIVKKETNTLGANTKFHFSENLFLAIKAKYTAECVIKEMHTKVKYKNVDGKEKETNRKPVIALRATGETLFDKLNLKKGDIVNNDFSEYLKAIVSGVRSGDVVLRKVNNDLYKRAFEMEEEDNEGNIIIKPFIERIVEYGIVDADFIDDGVEINRLIQSVMDYNADMPLAPIDYIIDKIQSTQRASWDKFGKAGKTRPNFKVGEITGRNYSLVKNSNGLWIYSPNEREKSTKRAFNYFNSGEIDVLIINASGSTGGSIHSSEYFADQRQRIMVITQVELNVSTEVQKRGRVNRSGQVNNPAYLYILSQVPSEMRKYLSLKKKLRRLDANTSANQTQNSNLVDIKDEQGKIVHDIFNKYGEEAFGRFISDDAIDERFKEINDLLTANALEEVFKEKIVTDSGETINANIYSFARELEIYPCDLQKEFYDKMNMLYRTIIDDHCVNGTYQLELSTEDLKASLQSRLVKQLNSGTSEFSKPLFIEDKYCLNRRRKWSKEKVAEEVTRMAVNFYQDRPDEFTTLDAFHAHLLEDFEVEFDAYLDEKALEIDSKEPMESDFKEREKYDEAMMAHENYRSVKLDDLRIEKSTIRALLDYYRPDRNIEFVDITGEGEDERKNYIYGKFVGYNIKPTGKHKYTKGSIHFRFAFIGGFVPSKELNINMNLNILEETKRYSITQFSSSRKRSDGKTEGEWLSNEVNEWKVEMGRRDLVRFLSGNILSAIEVANTMRQGREVKRWVLVKYTNADGTESTSIRLDPYEDKGFVPIKFLQEREERGSDDSQFKISVALDNQNIIEYLKSTPLAFVFSAVVDTMNSAKVNKVGNLIKVFKSKTDMNSVGIEIFHGVPDAKKKKDEVMLSGVAEPNDSDGNNPLYFAGFLNAFRSNKFEDKTYEIVKGRKGQGITSAYYVHSPEFKKEVNVDGIITKGVKAKAGYSKIFKFDAIDTEEGAKRLSLFFNKMYEEQKIKIDFPQTVSDYFVKIGEADIYVPPTEKQKEKERATTFEEGDYEYKLEVDFKKDERSYPPMFKEYVKGKTTFDKGFIVLGQPISPAYAKAYNVYPINLSDRDTVQLLLSIFTFDEKEVFITELTKMVEKGDTINQIGDFVSTTARNKTVPDVKYIFGKRRTNEIGELLKSMALKAELSAMAYEMGDDEETKAVKPSKKKDVITVDDAEKFINYLLF